MSLVKICRLSFNHAVSIMNQIKTFSLGYQMTLPNLLNINQLRTLTIGIHSSYFLERLLLCILFIENLSFGMHDRDINESDFMKKSRKFPATIDVHLLRHLSRLRIYCLKSISFHRTIAFLSSGFGQLRHLSLKLQACTFISGPLIISGDIIQQLCIDRFQPEQ
ncbi:unnamed protein product [Rotaria magnacalcarata]|uniref:Uncharacterized protein n=1 Tax=Rotaria magnacalcarata TaxID=392030 RepID=A0A816DH74_9BILA|nr:unnamed protein product [Rotaria magnacalcarata]CAF1919310.1 unnamed protein product [Rotaria magnacalcarata]CAF3856271.1 unnamed protein product [Rotaria magnacalcarata]CAF4500172.1 unnamed protein product [Rotaria magnacalcarata]